MFTETDVSKFLVIIFSQIVTTKSVIYNSETVKDKDHSENNVNNYKDSERYELLDVDINNVKNTWPEIYKKAPKNGFLLVTRTFREDPNIKEFFEDIITRNATDEEMANNPEFKCRIIDMMHILHKVIQNIKNPDILMPLLIKLGDYYKSIGVLRRHILVVQDVLMNFLRNDVMFTKQILESWENFIEEITLYLYLMILE